MAHINHRRHKDPGIVSVYKREKSTPTNEELLNFGDAVLAINISIKQSDHFILSNLSVTVELYVRLN